MIKTYLPLFFLLFSFVFFSQELDSRLIGLDDDIEELKKAYNAVGLSVVIVENDKIIYSKGFGKRNLEEDLKMNTATLVPIASSTKSFTAALLGIIESNNFLYLKEKPSYYITKLQFYNDKMNNNITIGDLLSHKSGIGNLDGSFVLFPPKSKIESIKRFKFLKPNSEIKNSFSYSNVSYGLASRVLEEVTKESWERNLKDKIFDPLNMNKTTTSISLMQKTNNYSLGYGKLGKNQSKVPYFKFGFIRPGGGIISNANEMGNWLIAWLNEGRFKNNQVIPKSFIKSATRVKNILTQNNMSSNNFLFGYGYGWFIQSLKGKYFVQHGGNTSGFSIQMAMFPFEKIGIVVLTNQHSSALPYNIEDVISNRMLKLPRKDIDKYKIQVAEIYQPKELENEKKMFGIKKYTGKYMNKGYGELKIIEEKGKLFAHFPEYIFRLDKIKNNIFVMEAISENSQFFNPNFQLKFLLNEHNIVNSFKIQLQSEPVLFKKIEL